MAEECCNCADRDDGLKWFNDGLKWFNYGLIMV